MSAQVPQRHAGGGAPDPLADSTLARGSLYVIPGSHACRTAMLMLEHKRVGYRVRELPTGAHPLIVRLRGFPGYRAPTRSIDGRTRGSVAMLDRLGTVPALALGRARVQTNRAIARFLEDERADPPLFPADPDQRREVEEAERWGDEVLQMAARRAVLAASVRDPDSLHERGASGRLGALLAHTETVRWLASRSAGIVFHAAPREQALMGALTAMLDHVDALIGAGVIGSSELNAADYMIAPSLALLSYRDDLAAEIAARPAGALIDRILPLPTPAA